MERSSHGDADEDAEVGNANEAVQREKISQLKSRDGIQAASSIAGSKLGSKESSTWTYSRLVEIRPPLRSHGYDDSCKPTE